MAGGNVCSCILPGFYPQESLCVGEIDTDGGNCDSGDGQYSESACYRPGSSKCLSRATSFSPGPREVGIATHLTDGDPEAREARQHARGEVLSEQRSALPEMPCCLGACLLLD